MSNRKHSGKKKNILIVMTNRVNQMTYKNQEGMIFSNKELVSIRQNMISAR